MKGKKLLITCEDWFLAPDGQQYKGARGTVRSVSDSQAVLGVRTNAKSANWYVQIGCLLIAGCQIHYAVECAEPPNFGRSPEAIWGPPDGIREFDRPTMIFNADATNTEEGR